MRSQDTIHGDASDYYKATGEFSDPRSLAASLGITAKATDDDIASLAEREIAEALAQGQDISGIYDYLIAIRDGLANA